MPVVFHADTKSVLFGHDCVIQVNQLTTLVPIERLSRLLQSLNVLAALIEATADQRTGDIDLLDIYGAPGNTPAPSVT